MSIVGETMTETGKEKTASAATDTVQGKANHYSYIVAESAG